jgi:hypothetical protein
MLALPGADALLKLGAGLPAPLKGAMTNIVRLLFVRFDVKGLDFPSRRIKKQSVLGAIVEFTLVDLDKSASVEHCAQSFIIVNEPMFVFPHDAIYAHRRCINSFYRIVAGVGHRLLGFVFSNVDL